MLFWSPFVLLALAVLAPLLTRVSGRASGWILGAVPAALFVHFLGYLPVGPGELVRESVEWVPGLDVEVAFLLDGLSLTFALLVTGIGALVLVYAGGYMAGDSRRPHLLAYLLAFLGAMLGLVLSDNLISLFVFWELTSVLSYLLRGIYHLGEASRAAALKALLVTGAGGLALLGGFVLLGVAGGQLGLEGADAWSISRLANVDVRGHPLYAAILVLAALGAFTKSAQFPFHFWLPAAMAAPTPVSALLHSATMVKAGVYLLARLSPMLSDTDLWQALLIPVGGLTMLGAAVLALGQKDLKRILAFSTVSVLGMLVWLLGAGHEKAVTAAVVLLVAHAFYKASLFMVAGSIDHETGTRDVTVLRGLRVAMPLTFAAGFLAALSKAGAPPMFGFVGKELFYKARLDAEIGRVLAILAAVATNVALVATALMVGLRPFLGRPAETPKKPHEAPASMLVGPVVLALAGLFVGLAPAPFDDGVGSAMASAIAGEPIDMHLRLWHGVNPGALVVLGLSAATLAVGVLVYRKTKRFLIPMSEFVKRCEDRGAAAWFDWALSALYRIARRITGTVQTGYLRHYVLVVVVAAVAAVGPPVVKSLLAHAPAAPESLRLHEILLVLLAAGGAVGAAVLRSRLASVAAVGVTGAAVALLFLVMSAPDLSITQTMVETLSVVLFAILFARLPRVVRRTRPPRRIVDLAVAAAAGTVMTLLVLASATSPADPAAARYFSEASYPEAHGRNVVNVILVDFRAIDTIGEIAVVAAAAFGVYALLRLLPGPGGGKGGGS